MIVIGVSNVSHDFREKKYVGIFKNQKIRQSILPLHFVILGA